MSSQVFGDLGETKALAESDWETRTQGQTVSNGGAISVHGTLVIAVGIVF